MCVIDHGSLGVNELSELKTKLLEYMRQDIYLLGGIMKRVQDIYILVLIQNRHSEKDDSASPSTGNI